MIRKYRGNLLEATGNGKERDSGEATVGDTVPTKCIRLVVARDGLLPLVEV